jgi:hypothetical protein
MRVLITSSEGMVSRLLAPYLIERSTTSLAMTPVSYQDGGFYNATNVRA